jgi:hypothetical protein
VAILFSMQAFYSSHRLCKKHNECPALWRLHWYLCCVKPNARALLMLGLCLALAFCTLISVMPSP